MAAVLWNDVLTSEDKVSTLITNRGFLYGDGFFETLVLKEGKLFFLDAHLERALHAMQVLQLQTDSVWNLEQLKNLLSTLWKENGSPKEAVFKWMMWRNSEGLYSPTHTGNSHFLIELKPYRLAPAIKAHAYLAKSVTNVPSLYSSFKRLSALHYVMAGLEKTNRKADELILTDQYGNLSEATSSGLFWINHDTLYTPSLETGCVEGVVRKTIFKWAANSSVKVKEVKTNHTSLPSESTVFTGNIAGLSLIGQIENTAFKNDHPLYKQLQNDLFHTTTFSQSL